MNPYHFFSRITVSAVCRWRQDRIRQTTASNRQVSAPLHRYKCVTSDDCDRQPRTAIPSHDDLTCERVSRTRTDLVLDDCDQGSRDKAREISPGSCEPMMFVTEGRHRNRARSAISPVLGCTQELLNLVNKQRRCAFANSARNVCIRGAVVTCGALHRMVMASDAPPEQICSV